MLHVSFLSHEIREYSIFKNNKKLLFPFLEI